MHHLILGYGYCGYYLAQELLKDNQQVTAVSRHLDNEMKLPHLSHLKFDLNKPLHWTEPDTTVYYLIPPPSQGNYDSFLRQFLTQSVIKAKKIIYFGSSGVYGNHHGAWVDERSECVITNPRQLRRLDAEHQWLDYCNQQAIECILLRVAGIYGPHRLPIEAAKTKMPLIERDEAPFTNQIYIKDLASIAYSLASASNARGLYSVADGDPQPMGTLQQRVAEALNLEQAPIESWNQTFERASPMKREFMHASKKLSIQRLKATMGTTLSLTPMLKAISQSF